MNTTEEPGDQCHVCGSPDVAYWHTIHTATMPYIMVNLGYCERCAKLLDKFEQDLHLWVKEAEE